MGQKGFLNFTPAVAGICFFEGDGDSGCFMVCRWSANGWKMSEVDSKGGCELVGDIDEPARYHILSRFELLEVKGLLPLNTVSRLSPRDLIRFKRTHSGPKAIAAE